MASPPYPFAYPNAFQPMFVFPSEYAYFGLPGTSDQPDIDNLVQMASSMIDEYCGRTDGDGNGSLVYTTYAERLLFQAPGRNLTLLPLKPVVALSVDTIASLQALDAASGGFYFTGVQPSIYTLANGQLSGIIACSGRYGYVRRDMSQTYPDLNALINPQNLISLFGGPPPWIPVDCTNIDYDAKTGEMWVPAGLQLQRYSEVIILYNSGYDPRNMPRLVKSATAALTKNLMAKGSGTTGITAQSLGRAAFSVTLSPDAIDTNIQMMLKSFKTVRAY
jgi:hypothetical protein